jgi:hypothetical protein
MNRTLHPQASAPAAHMLGLDHMDSRRRVLMAVVDCPHCTFLEVVPGFQWPLLAAVVQDASLVVGHRDHMLPCRSSEAVVAFVVSSHAH